MRKHLIWVLGLTGLVAALAGASIAQGVPNTQTIIDKVKPKKLPKQTKVPVTNFTDVSSTNAGNPNQIPNPTTLSKVDFDKDFLIQQKGLPTCDPSQFTAATTTQQARNLCGDSEIGTGTSKIAIPTGPSTPPLIVTALTTGFNGKNKTLVLHTYNSLSGEQTLVGKFSHDPSAGAKYKTTLTTPVPPLAGGTAVISDFNLNTTKKYSFHGKKLGSTMASCSDKKLQTQARFTDNQGQVATDTYTQKCKQK